MDTVGLFYAGSFDFYRYASVCLKCFLILQCLRSYFLSYKTCDGDGSVGDGTLAQNLSHQKVSEGTNKASKIIESYKHLQLLVTRLNVTRL